ncbi:MAG: Protein GrpE [Acidimicrobiales bacterium]|nr:MAG: nucleotide exchange factor GrpE [Actinomycetota bacterium]MBV6507380.1 Protein GrpE [Acidimicrobiales bacterium]RIK04506.1 MAG: nucleotide exchange factor GrpE [Acidobacteriota bacterium]
MNPDGAAEDPGTFRPAGEAPPAGEVAGFGAGAGPGPEAHPEQQTVPPPDPAAEDPAGAFAEVSAADSADEPADEPAAAAGDDITALRKERDEYLDALRRVQADFENYRKRVDKQRGEQIERAEERLVTELLPVLDACDAALAHDAQAVEPIYNSLLSTLEKQGLTRVADVDTPFDPQVHEAVAHEEGDDDRHVVTEIMRAGYLWHNRVLRPAMVKVRG